MTPPVLTLPQGTKFGVVPDGTVRHILEPGGQSTWCHMIYRVGLLKPYKVNAHGDLPICGACLRTTKARSHVR